jgi:glycosyltransferase involved in cell wall biosynthesis
MKILMASESFLPDLGGVEVFTARLAAALLDRGHEVALITSRAGLTTSEEERWRGMPVYRLPFAATLQGCDHDGVIALRRRVAELKRALRPDVIHLNTSGASLVFHLLTSRTSPAPNVLTVHWLPNGDGVDLRVCERALGAADWIVAVTQGCLREALQRRPAIAARACVIYNSLPPVAVTPTPLAAGAPRLLCIGRWERQKGFDVAIRALAAVRRRWPAAEMTIAGGGTEREPLAQLVGTLGLSDAVRFTGWIAPDDVPHLINAHTMVVMPSRYEPFGLVALQAAQMSRPVVGSRVPGLAEVVRDGDTGLLCAVDDAAAFAAAIASLIECPAAAAEMGRRARAYVRTAFAWDDHVDAYETLFRRVAAQAAA